MGDIVNTFDRKVACFWAIITLGIWKALENTVKLAVRLWIDSNIAGVDVSIIVGYLGLAMLGFLGLLIWKSIHNTVDERSNS